MNSNEGKLYRWNCEEEDVLCGEMERYLRRMEEREVDGDGQGKFED